MDNPNLKDPYVAKPSLTSDGRKWTQRCMICLKPVNFLKDKPWVQYVTVGPYVRHKRCYPI